MTTDHAAGGAGRIEQDPVEGLAVDPGRRVGGIGTQYARRNTATLQILLDPLQPPRIVIHGNRTGTIPEAYRRYLANCFIKHFKLRGTPLLIEFRDSDNPYKDRKNVLTDRQVAKRRRLKTVMQELMYLAARVVKSARTFTLRFSKHCPAFAAFERTYDKLAYG